MPNADASLRHVLCVAYFFPPAGGAGVQRPLKFVKYLPTHGWRCHVLTVRNGAFFADDKTLLEDIEPNTEIIRTPSWEIERLSMFRAARRRHSAGQLPALTGLERLLRAARTWILPDPQIGWLPHAVRAAQALATRQRIDAIWTTSSPFTSHLVGATLKQLLNVPWIADFRDPWSADPMGLLAHHRVHALLERAVIERADRVVGVTEGLVDFLRTRDRNARPDKYQVIPNGFDAEDFTAVRGAPLNRFDDGKWHITMTGSVYAKVDIVPFLEALARFIEVTPAVRGAVRMHWVGQMDRLTDAAYHAAVRRLQLDDVCERIGYVAHAESIGWLLRSHLLLLPMYVGEDAQHWMPGKIFEYLASRTPILACADTGVAADLVQRARAGLVANPQDVDGMAHALRRLWTAHQEGKDVMIRDDSVVKSYERCVLTSRLASVLNDLVPGDALAVGL